MYRRTYKLVLIQMKTSYRRLDDDIVRIDAVNRKEREKKRCISNYAFIKALTRISNVCSSTVVN